MEKDIFYYVNLLNDNILLIEKNKNDNQAILAVKESFYLVFEQIKLFLISKKDRYYGYFLMNLKLEMELYQDIVAGIRLDKTPFVLVVNPLILGKYKIKEMIYIICHEIEHLILEHPSLGGKLNPSHLQEEHLKLNLAMDASVNDRLNYEVESGSNIMASPTDAVTSLVLMKKFQLKRIEKMQSFLYYYQLIGKKKVSDDLEKKYLNKGGCLNIDETGNKMVVTIQDSNGRYCHDWAFDGLREDLKGVVRRFVLDVIEGIPEESRGLFPSYQQEVLNRILKSSEIRWEQVLKRYIGMIPIPSRKTKMRLNRREPLRFDLPGRMNEHTVRLVVAIDTSGSMSDKMLEKVFVEIFEILKKKKYELTVIECDSEIGRVYQAKKIGDIEMKVTGRGGTCFTPVIDYVNQNIKLRDSVFVYFTDGYGEEKIPRPKTYRNLWVIIGKKENLSVRNPYGEVLEISHDYYEDY